MITAVENHPRTIIMRHAIESLGRSMVPLIVGPRFGSSKVLRETYGERFLRNRKHGRFANHFLARRSSTRLEFDKRRVNPNSDLRNLSFLSSDVAEEKNKIAAGNKLKCLTCDRWTTSMRERGCKNFRRTYNASPLLIQR